MKNLEYSVAWIDDQPEHLEGFKGGLQNRLARLGLDLKVDIRSTKEQLGEFLATEKEPSRFDLVLVDWKLGQMVAGRDESGATVAASVRGRLRFTNIIFYSSESPGVLREKIAAQKIDGVWCVNRKHFVAEVWYVIEAALRKIDLNAMRGLFMDAVAEFDALIKGAVMRIHEQSTQDTRVRMANSLIESRIQYMKEQLAKIEASRGQNLGKLLKAAGTFELFAILKKLNDAAAPIDNHHEAVSERFNMYDADIIIPRNDLAHARAEPFEGTRVLKRGDRVYGWEDFGRLRITLTEQHDNLTLLIDKYLAEIARICDEDPEGR